MPRSEHNHSMKYSGTGQVKVWTQSLDVMLRVRSSKYMDNMDTVIRCNTEVRLTKDQDIVNRCNTES